MEGEKYLRMHATGEDDHLHQASTTEPLAVGSDGAGYFRCGIGMCQATGYREKGSATIIWTS